jgi:hypothetical protein
MRIALSLTVLIALASPALADEVGVVVDGDGSIQPQLTAQLADWLTRHGHSVVASPLPAEAVPLFTDAMKTDNLSSGRDIVEKQATAASLVYARVDVKTKATSGARDLTVNVYWLVKGHDATSQKQDCARCTDQLLRETTENVMRKLLGGGALGHVKLKSSPPGARIVIDGQPIGITPLDWDLPTGKHTIQMDKAGHRPTSRDVVIASDNLEVVVETLEPVADTGGGRSSRVVPVLVLTAGVALLATGGVMIAIDEDPDPTGNTEFYRDTGPTGIGIAIGGAVVTALGGYLLYRTGSATSTSTPVAAVTSDMAYVGWLGQF